MRLLLVAASVLLLAGCSSTPATPAPSSSAAAPATSSASPAPAVDASTYTITLQGFPTGTVAAGSTFNFTDVVHGAVTHASDHIGAHFGLNSTTTPSTAIYNMTCVHTIGNLPGSFPVSCHAPMAPGTYYLRGHARITKADSTQVSWWSAEQTFTVA